MTVSCLQHVLLRRKINALFWRRFFASFFELFLISRFAKMSSLNTQLQAIQNALTRYGMTTYLVFGNIGFILSAIIFCQPHHRQKPCSLYLFSANTCRMIAMNVAVIPIIYALDYPNPSSTSLIFCQLQYYFRHVPNQMMRTFIIVACIDRYALCKLRTRMRFFNRYSVAVRIVIGIVISWLVLASFIPVFQTIKNGKCGRFNDIHIIIYTVYNVITTGILPPFFMILFGILIVIQLRQIRSRVQPVTTGERTKSVLRKQDRYLIKITLIEIFVYLITTTPYTVVLLYSTITTSMSKSSERQQIESFITYISQSFLLHLYNALPFWIYLLASTSFRVECIRAIVKPCATAKENSAATNTLNMQ